MKKILLIIIFTLAIFQMVILATEIDIGTPAIDRANYRDWSATYVAKENPANASGTITSVQLYAFVVDLANCEVATFYIVSGDNLSTRDTETIGIVVAGATRTFEVNLDVEAGDFIGVKFTAGYLRTTSQGGIGFYLRAGDAIPCTDVLFQNYTGTLSLYGTGATEEEEEEANAIFFGTNF